MAKLRESLTLPGARVQEAGIATLAQLFSARVALSPHSQACRHFDAASASWHPHTWAQLDARVDIFTACLAAEGVQPGERVAIHLENSVEWLVIEQAIYRLGAVSVGLYAVETPEVVSQLLNDSGASLLFTRHAAAWAAISAIGPLPGLRKAVLMQGDSEASPEGIAVSANRFLATPASTPDWQPVATESLASLVYTSGSSGLPKGAMMSHAALLANVFAVSRAFDGNDHDVRLALLPLSHSFERVAGWYHGIVVGSETVFSRGVDHLSEDLMAIHPTALIGVPRLFEHLYARLLRNIDEAPLHVRALFHLAQQAGQAQSAAPMKFSKRLTQGLSNAIRQSLGGALTKLVSGGAPLCPQISGTFAALDLPILQGYGLTEAGPVVSVNRRKSNDPESAGVPLDNVTLRIAPDGELLVRSPALMQGYWNDASATKAAIDDAGWLHTGDKASRLDSEQLYLTGRLKDVLVTSTGMKVSPSGIEAQITGDPMFEQAMVVGEARPFLVALLVAEASRLETLKAELGLGTVEDEASRGKLSDALLAKVALRLKAYPATSQIKAVSLVPAFTLANGLLTATAKPRRASIARHYSAAVERLYSGHDRSLKSDCSSNAEIGGR